MCHNQRRCDMSADCVDCVFVPSAAVYCGNQSSYLVIDRKNTKRRRSYSSNSSSLRRSLNLNAMDNPNFLLRISKEATENDLAPVQDAGRRKTILQRMSTMSSKPLNPDWVRQKVIEEIMSTEEEFVKQLKNIIDGPLKQARLRTDLFTEDTINTLFCNIEEVYEFQKGFLSSLKSQLKSYIYKSELGDTFKDNQQEFVEVYSRYCNNYSSAIAEYTLLNNQMVYSIFFESCRLLQEMKDISLDGFLLTPVQRICKYPLQLRELQKYTNPSHTDFAPVKAAEQLMTMVAETVNERKRRTENIQTLVQWQTSIENWRGEDILHRSSVMIHSGPCCKISAGNKQGRIFFLFDHQLVYCRKVLHGKLQYKGRLDLDVCQLIDCEDNSEPGLYNAWKLKNTEKDKWITIYTKKSEDKAKWMHAFKAERSQVLDDKKNNFIIPDNQRKAAYANIQCPKNLKSLERSKKNTPQKYKSTSSLIEEENDKKKMFSNKMFQKKSKKNVLS